MFVAFEREYRYAKRGKVAVVFDRLFKSRRVVPKQLLTFVFSRRAKAYTYSAALVEGQFKLLVTIMKDGVVTTDVIDAESGESYALYRVHGASGEIVGRVREESEKILAKIAATCFEPDVFQSDGARRAIRYVREKYGGELEFLWQPTSDNAVYRRRDNAKWYAALLTVRKSKLDLAGDEQVEILDLRGRPEDIDALVDGKKYFPGYYMNKKHWFTICFDDSISPDEIHARIDESYTLAANTPGKDRHAM